MKKSFINSGQEDGDGLNENCYSDYNEITNLVSVHFNSALKS